MLAASGSNLSLNYHQITNAGIMPGKLSVPVRASLSAYASFRHVHGVPAREEGQGYSLNKIKVMDAMIEHLQARKSEREKMFSEIESGDGLNRLLEEVHRKLSDPGQGNPFREHFSVSPMIVDILV